MSTWHRWATTFALLYCYLMALDRVCLDYRAGGEHEERLEYLCISPSHSPANWQDRQDRQRWQKPAYWTDHNLEYRDQSDFKTIVKCL